MCVYNLYIKIDSFIICDIRSIIAYRTHTTILLGIHLSMRLHCITSELDKALIYQDIFNMRSSCVHMQGCAQLLLQEHVLYSSYDESHCCKSINYQVKSYMSH